MALNRKLGEMPRLDYFLQASTHPTVFRHNRDPRCWRGAIAVHISVVKKVRDQSSETTELRKLLPRHAFMIDRKAGALVIYHYEQLSRASISPEGFLTKTALKRRLKDLSSRIES